MHTTTGPFVCLDLLPGYSFPLFLLLLCNIFRNQLLGFDIYDLQGIPLGFLIARYQLQAKAHSLIIL